MKQNAFWVALGGAGVLLVLLFTIQVVPKITRQATIQNDLKKTVDALQDQIAGISGTPDMEDWAKYRDGVIRAYEGITKFYANSDKHLERWFTHPNLVAAIGDNPPRDSFISRYTDEANKIENELGKKGTQVGILTDEEDPGKGKKFGFNWERPDPNQLSQVDASGPGEELKILKEIQKRFWIRQRVANIVLNGNVKVSRVVDFRFFKKLHDKLATAPWETPPTGKEALQWQGIVGGAGRSGFQEADLPNELGKTLTFGFALDLPYSEVPKVIEGILNPGTEAAANERLLVNLIGTHITIRGQNEPTVEFNYIQGDVADQMARTEAAKKGIKPHDVRLAVTCQIVDFDSTNVKRLNDRSQP
jgi:hypothetical protein